MTLIPYVLSKLRPTKDVVRQISKKLRLRTPFDSHHAKGSQTLLKEAPQ